MAIAPRGEDAKRWLKRWGSLLDHHEVGVHGVEVESMRVTINFFEDTTRSVELAAIEDQL